MKTKILFLLSLVLLLVDIYGQPNANDFDLICYCSGETPHSVVSYDNNLQLILLFKNGLTLKQLDSLQISYTKSQIKLLKLYNLLRQENKVLYSNIAILENENSVELREYSRSIAEKILPFVETDILELNEHLSSINRSKNAFSITFSYVLDGLIWKEFEAKGITKPIENNENSPWTGHFWMLESKRSLGFGTNSYSDSTVTIAITNGAPYQLTKSFYKEREIRKLLLNDIKLYNKVIDERVLRTFEEFKIIDSNGEITIPIIYENNQNELYSLSKRISRQICNKTLDLIVLDEIIEKYNFSDNEQAIIVLYHEIMWELLEIILEKGIMEIPIILKEPEQAEVQNISDILYIIKKD